MLRRVSLAVFALLIMSSLQVRASGIDEKPFDQQSIDELVAKASPAQPREQCFLYAEAVHEMTELSIRQYAAGDEKVRRAAQTDSEVRAQDSPLHVRQRQAAEER